MLQPLIFNILTAQQESGLAPILLRQRYGQRRSRKRELCLHPLAACRAHSWDHVDLHAAASESVGQFANPQHPAFHVLGADVLDIAGKFGINGKGAALHLLAGWVVLLANLRLPSFGDETQFTPAGDRIRSPTGR